MTDLKICKLCGKEFLPDNNDDKYCCEWCEKRAAWYYQKAEGSEIWSL